MADPVDVTVVTSGHDVADARLHREVAALCRAGLRVEVLGLGDAAAGPPGAATRTRRRRGPLGRAVLAVTLPWRARGRVLLSLDPDSALGCWAAARLRRRHWVCDVHEDYPSLLRDRPWATGVAGRLAGAVARTATAVAARADVTVVADDHLPPTGPGTRRRLVVRNLPDPEALRPVRAARGVKDAALRAAYVGDLRISRGLRAMVEAVAAAPGWQLDLVGPVAAADQDWLAERLSRPDVAGRVRVHGRLDPVRSWQAVAGAAVGLALLEDTPAFRAAVPTKVYEYLAAGLAVLATPLPRVAALLDASGGGVLVADPAAAAAVLRDWSADPAALAVVRDRAAAWADEHLDGAAETDRLATAVSTLLGR